VALDAVELAAVVVEVDVGDGGHVVWRACYDGWCAARRVLLCFWCPCGYGNEDVVLLKGSRV
jgi:hypothetical protein